MPRIRNRKAVNFEIFIQLKTIQKFSKSVGNINNSYNLTLSWRRPLSYRNQPIDLLCKSMDWFLYDNGLPHERVNVISISMGMSSTGIYLFKVNNKNTRKMCKICTKLTMKALEQRQWRHSGAFIVEFEQILSSWTSKCLLTDFTK